VNDWAEPLRAFRFGYVRGAVAVVFILTILIWILEVTEDDSPFPRATGTVHSGHSRTGVEQPQPGQAAETACPVAEQHGSGLESYEQLPAGSDPIPGINVPGGF
jgi:hypothetical protein